MSRRNRRNRAHRKYRTPPGTPPGELITDPESPRPQIRLIAYGPDSMTEQAIEDIRTIPSITGKWPVVWINVDGLGDAAVLGSLADMFEIHRLAMEDVIGVHQRAKVELYKKNYFIVARMPDLKERLETEQLSLFLGPGYVLTFQERPGDCFGPVRERIRKTGGRIRALGSDYLAYALLDTFIDSYFPVLEKYGERIEDLEDAVILNPGTEVMSQIHEIKRDLLTLRRAAWPVREAISILAREPSALILDETRIYLRDCYDHTIQIIDLLENYRDVAGGLMEVYLSSVSNRLNEIMKILTIFTAIFIPLNFIAGIYGMNFKSEASAWNMPELSWRFGYFFALGLMAVLAVVMLFYFRKKGWFGRSR